MPSSRGSSQPGNRTHISCIASRSFTADPLGKPCFSMTDGILRGELDLAHECVMVYPPDMMGSHQKGPTSHNTAAAEPKMTLYLPNSRPGVASRAPFLLFNSRSPPRVVWGGEQGLGL